MITNNIISRLIDVLHNNGDKKLHLVFEYLDQDLKKYIDSHNGQPMAHHVIKVRAFSIISLEKK